MPRVLINPQQVRQVCGRDEVPRTAISDPATQRFQDDVRNAFQALAARSMLVPPRMTPTAVPPASESYAGRIITVGMPGTATVVKICVLNSKKTYEWLTLATSS